ncbi:PREDICTED: uncharacterized protein LOC104609943 isoform X2 [Nelumbo nucifera]|uniref:Uncharacterized protein LOC104609943 isoform X2 n=1 Tax=Nelumbo nucifera TaxID=4432 RepID=A0A1U8BE90_NELNU|nr:PREDICTED: uncharacterized protein LOC104609943 isoform X2 [Nelumbo nucifera]XP_019055405.1 PREDICTED: uncharacterized protein LOC104609943 isoform X2 [Nelumbo nucifera]
MDFDLDPFADILPSSGNARAGAKFQPKAKPRPRKEAASTSTKIPSNAIKENTVTNTADSSLHGSTTEKPVTRITDSSSRLLITEGMTNNAKTLHSGLPISDGAISSEPVESLSQIAVNQKIGGSGDALNSKVAASNSHVDLQSGFGKLGETADILSELEFLDNILSQSASATANSANEFQSDAVIDDQTGSRPLTSHPITTKEGDTISSPGSNILHASNYQDSEVFSSIGSENFRAFNSTSTEGSTEFLNRNRDLQVDNGKSKREEQVAFHGLGTLGVISEATTMSDGGNIQAKSNVHNESGSPITPSSHPDAEEFVSFPEESQMLSSEIEHLDDNSLPAFPSDGFLDFSTMRVPHSAPMDYPSEFPVTEETAPLPEVPGLGAEVTGKEMDSQAITGTSTKETRKRKSSKVCTQTVKKTQSQNFEEPSPISAANEENETTKSSRKLRKRVVRDSEEIEDDNLPFEHSNDSIVDEEDNNDEEDDEYRGENTFSRRGIMKKMKKPTTENEKPVRRHKKVSEGSDPSNKEQPKKKFSHSTRRKRRQVDKVYLETPDEEINPQKLVIKDLIMLAEAKERISNKEASTLKKSVPNQSAKNSPPQDTFFDEQDPFTSAQGLNSDDDQANHTIQKNSFKLNYHSFMDRTPHGRWSKQDTELFYQAVRQFGTDFAMIQQLFPNRSRHQVKLKYKKEERKHPSLLYDALTNRSKDHSHFELVIERLQQATAQAEKDSGRDEESFGLTGEEEEVTHEKNEEVAKPEQEKAAKDLEPKVPEVHSPVKSHESEDDLFYRWSQYKSIDDFYPEDTGKGDYEMY